MNTTDCNFSTTPIPVTEARGIAATACGDSFPVSITDADTGEVVRATFLVDTPPAEEDRITAFAGMVSYDGRVSNAWAEVEVRRLRLIWELGQGITKRALGVKPPGTGLLRLAVERRAVNED